HCAEDFTSLAPQSVIVMVEQGNKGPRRVPADFVIAQRHEPGQLLHEPGPSQVRVVIRNSVVDGDGRPEVVLVPRASAPWHAAPAECLAAFCATVAGPRGRSRRPDRET